MKNQDTYLGISLTLLTLRLYNPQLEKFVIVLHFFKMHLGRGDDKWRVETHLHLHLCLSCVSKASD